MFERGGNAVDAGVAAGLALNVLLPEWTGIGGVAPILVLEGKSGKVSSISGLGRWPRATDASLFREQYEGRIPSGVLRCVTPGALGAWLTALRRFGRLRLEDVVDPALQLAEHGTPVHGELHRCLASFQEKLSRWPGTVAMFYPDGGVPALGTRLRQTDLAQTLRRMINAALAHDNRERGIEAAYDLFYRGDIAYELAEYFEREGGWLRYEDLAEFEITVEEAVHIEYRGMDVFSGGPWCQGPVVLQTLRLLELEDVSRLGHNSVDYIHLCVEAFKLAFADRGAFYGDPDFVAVPINGLLSQDYARSQRSRIHSKRCANGLPSPGDPWLFEPKSGRLDAASAKLGSLEEGTSYVCAVDSEGNAFSAAPSDGIQSSPIVPGLGFAVSSRGGQSWVEDSHPSSIHPRKRPFLTPTPGLAMRDGRFFLAYGTPGMDTQPQTLVQFIANVIDFGMDPQQAVEAPRFATQSFPRAFDPHDSEPNSLYLEGRIEENVVSELTAFGHDVKVWPEFTSEAGVVCAIMADWKNETLIGAADPRRLSYAIGW